VRFTFGQGLRSGAQVGPSSLKIGKRLCKALLRLRGIARLEAQLLLALSYELTKLLWDSLSELIDSGFRMLPRSDIASGILPPFCANGVALSL